MPSTANETGPKLKLVEKPRILKRWLNPVISFVLWLSRKVERNTPLEGRNVKLDRDPTGTTINVDIGLDSLLKLFPAKPFQLVGMSDPSSPQVRVIISDLVGDLPDGFTAGDDPPYLLDAVDGDVVYACVVWSVSAGVVGAVTGRTLGADASVPADDPTGGTFYYRIGTVTVDGDGNVTTNNEVYGPIDATAYRDWYSSPVTFGIAWNANAAA